MKGFQAVPELIRRGDMPVVFTMLAHTNAPWLGWGLENGSFRLVKTRHEETATAAATAYTRVTRKLGVVSVQRGPGFANAVNALLAAATSHSPMLLIVAESPATKELSAKNIDQRGFTQLIGAGFHHVASGRHLEQGFRDAIRDAWVSGLPQVLSIGDGVLDEDIVLSDEERLSIEPMEPDELDASAIALAVQALAEAHRPLIIAGQGAVVSNCREELEELAALCGADLSTTLYATQFFSGHARNLGVCGTWAPTTALQRFIESDVVLAVGASLNRYTTAEEAVIAGKKVIQIEIDIEQPFHASPPELGILGDARLAVRALIDAWRASGLPSRNDGRPELTLREVQASVMMKDLGHDPVRGLDLREVVLRLNDLLPQNRIVVTDSGRHMAPLPTLVDAPDARSWVVSRGYGSVGLGIGAAVGAAAADTGRRVVLICGDGGFMMGAQGLDCFGINGLSATIVLLNDQMYGAEVGALRQYGLQTAIAAQPMPDVALWTRALRGHADVVTTMSELEAIDFDRTGLHVIDIRIDPEVNHFAAVG